MGGDDGVGKEPLVGGVLGWSCDGKLNCGSMLFELSGLELSWITDGSQFWFSFSDFQGSSSWVLRFATR